MKVIKTYSDVDYKLILNNYWNKFSKLFPKVSKDQFCKWIKEDTYIGWEEAGHTHAAGRRELKMLYATIRAAKPKSILEIGTYRGDSANHILLACENNKSEGFPCSVTLLDIKDYLDKKLHDYPYERIIENSIEHLPDSNYEFIVQDGSHAYDMVKNELHLFSKIPGLRTVWAHDYYLPNRGVKPAWDEIADTIFKEWIPFNELAYIAGFVIAKK